MWRSKIFKVEWPELPKVRKCCFFIPARRGIIIFGYINLTVSLLAILLLLCPLPGQLDSLSGQLDSLSGQLDGPIGYPGSQLDRQQSGNLDNLSGQPGGQLPLTAVTLPWISVDLATSLLLVIAAHKNNRTLLKAYLYFGIAFEVLTLYVDFVLFEHGDYLETLVYFFFTGLHVYLLYMVYCTIHMLKESSEVQYVAHQDTI